ncbi:MAG: trkH 1 [Alphaproteobacteria bacterium]|nr:trkH 1 [Alphaproteobacteria bacterium]
MAVDIRSPLYILGILLCIFSFGMVLPAFAEWVEDGADAGMFLICFGVTFFAGGTLAVSFRPRDKVSIDVHQAFVLTALAWIVITLFAAIPLSASSAGISYTDAVFEAMSGVTGTGATVLVGLEQLPAGILWWRTILVWFGGVGIIVMAVAVLPFLRIGGMQLFRAESSEKSEKTLPRMSQISAAITVYYFFVSIAGSLLLWATGLKLGDAIHHGFGAVATGGFSTLDSSFGGFKNPAAEYIMTVLMFIGGMTFIVMIQSWRARQLLFLRDSQIRAYFLIVMSCALTLTLWRWGTSEAPLEEAFRHSIFHVVSIITTAGFATTDYTTWGTFPIVMMLFLTFIGACTGSTSGGVKVFRYQILYQLARVQIAKLTHPNAVIVPRFNGREVSREVINSVAGFVFLWFFCFIVLSIALSLFGLDIDTAISGAASALGNVGPGVGETIGPAGTFQPLPDGAKWLLSFGMLLGRLEMLTLLILLMPSFWRA